MSDGKEYLKYIVIYHQVRKKYKLMHEYAMIELALLKEKLTGLLWELLACKLQSNRFLGIIVNILYKIHF